MKRVEEEEQGKRQKSKASHVYGAHGKRQFYRFTAHAHKSGGRHEEDCDGVSEKPQKIARLDCSARSFILITGPLAIR